MDSLRDILSIDYSWIHMLYVILLLAAIWTILYFLNKTVAHLSIDRTYVSSLKRILFLIQVYFEPLAVVLVLSMFVVIRPVLHGIFIVILAVGSYQHFRNYLNGKILQGRRTLRPGLLIRTDQKEGIITDLTKLGLSVKSDDGLHFIPYHMMLSKGYTLAAGDQIGGYYKLEIYSESKESESNVFVQLSNLILSSPYLDGDYRPEIERSLRLSDVYEVKLLVKEESHIKDLISVLEENGFKADLSKL